MVSSLVLSLAVATSGGLSGQTPPDDMLAGSREAIQSGTIAQRLTEPEEIVERFGAPQKSEEETDGGMLIRFLHYPDTVFVFGRFRDFESPFTLLAVRHREQEIDIGQDGKLTLRHSSDITKVDPFNGLENVSLVKVDPAQPGFAAIPHPGGHHIDGHVRQLRRVSSVSGDASPSWLP